MNVLHKIRKGIDLVLSWVCAALFALMVIVGTYQIVVRYFFNSPSTVSEELLTYSFTWMALLASAYVFGKRDHMRMGFIADKLTGTPRKVLEIIIEILVMFLAGSVMVYGKRLYPAESADPSERGRGNRGRFVKGSPESG